MSHKRFTNSDCQFIIMTSMFFKYVQSFYFTWTLTLVCHDYHNLPCNQWFEVIDF